MKVLFRKDFWREKGLRREKLERDGKNIIGKN